MNVRTMQAVLTIHVVYRYRLRLCRRAPVPFNMRQGPATGGPQQAPGEDGMQRLISSLRTTLEYR